jgi:hypothetical protein
MSADPNPRLPDANPDLSSLVWQQFEQLCEALLQRLYPHGVMPFNQSGVGQCGADFIVVHPDGTLHAYECKRVRAITGTMLATWVGNFADDALRPRCQRFTILSTVEPGTELTIAVLDHMRDLRAQGIGFSLHGPRWFYAMFARFPDVAAQFFGPAWGAEYAKRNAASIERARVAQLHAATPELEADGRTYRFKNGYVYVHATLPDAESRGISALITIHEIGMHESMITLGNDSLLDAFDESSWKEGKPFFVGSYAGNDYLQIGNVRLAVPPEVGNSLARAMRDLRERWHRCIAARDDRRETHGFQHVDTGRWVKIGCMRAALWRAILRFAAEHDHAHGEGGWNVFEEHDTMLKVFTARASAMTDAGYHAIVESRPIVSWRTHDAEWIDILWTEPPAIFGSGDAIGKRAWWGAASVVRWLESELIPAVWAWAHHDPRPAWRRALSGARRQPLLVLADHWSVCRADRYEQEAPTDGPSLKRYFAALQRHYSLRLEAGFPAAFRRLVDEALLFCAERTHLDYYGYVISKADLDADDRAGVIDQLRRRVAARALPVDGSGLEWHLRACHELAAKGGHTLHRGEIESLAGRLRPLAAEADAYNIRLAHRFEPAVVFPK